MHWLRRAILASGSIACAVGVGVVSSAIVFAGSAGLPRGGKVVASVRIPQGSGGLAVGEGAVWAMSDSASTLLRIDRSETQSALGSRSNRTIHVRPSRKLVAKPRPAKALSGFRTPLTTQSHASIRKRTAFSRRFQSVGIRMGSPSRRTRFGLRTAAARPLAAAARPSRGSIPRRTGS